MDRNQKIIRYNLISMGINLALAVFKIIIGLSVHSMAIMLDAVDGLSDVLGSVLSIVSAKTAGRKSDKLHPLGYGRLEYLGSLAITILIMAVGARAVWDSVHSILSPRVPPEYSTAAIVIMAVSMVCKASYGLLLRKKGAELRSTALIMTGTDGLSDSVVSAGILFGIMLQRTRSFNVEPYMCIIISVLIFFTGIGMLRECTNKIIGTRPDPEFKRKITKMLVMESGVLNVSNLVIHSYGENINFGSVDIEVDENMTAGEVTRLSRRLIRKAREYDLTLNSVGITGSNLRDPEAVKVWDIILDKLHEPKYKDILRAQLFVMDTEEQVISFYVVLDYDSITRDITLKKFREDLAKTFPDKRIEIYTAIDI